MSKKRNYHLFTDNNLLFLEFIEEFGGKQINKVKNGFGRILDLVTINEPEKADQVLVPVERIKDATVYHEPLAFSVLYTINKGSKKTYSINRTIDHDQLTPLLIDSMNEQPLQNGVFNIPVERIDAISLKMAELTRQETVETVTNIPEYPTTDGKQEKRLQNGVRKKELENGRTRCSMMEEES